MVERRVNELLPHLGFTRHTLGYSTQEISALSDRGQAAYLDPLTITQDNYVVDGYAVWQLAKMQHRATVPCIVRNMSQEEALIYLIEKNRGSKGINDFVRILMALELEPWFKSRAKSNQRIGGREKGSSQLTDADRLDVRLEIARASGVSAGNVSKVKQLLQDAIPELHEALRLGEIRISRAAAWAKTSPTVQRHRLNDHRNGRGIHRTIRRLLKKHEPRRPKICDGLRNLEKGLKELQGDECLSSLLEPLSQVIGMIGPLLASSDGATDAS
jgi:ParB-like chromosome segregation protein Spo0J